MLLNKNNKAAANAAAPVLFCKTEAEYQEIISKLTNDDYSKVIIIKKNAFGQGVYAEVPDLITLNHLPDDCRQNNILYGVCTTNALYRFDAEAQKFIQLTGLEG